MRKGTPSLCKPWHQALQKGAGSAQERRIRPNFCYIGQLKCVKMLYKAVPLKSGLHSCML